MTGSIGRCPKCERSRGSVGEPCLDSVCVQHGYHLVPAGLVDPKARHFDKQVGQVLGGYLILRKISGERGPHAT